MVKPTKQIIRPYGDRRDDGVVQLSFTLPVALSEKAKEAASLRGAMDLAGGFDRKIVVEAAVPDAREMECGVLGNEEAQASPVGRKCK